MGSITITSGTLRGRRIQTPEGSQTRPLLTRLRKSLADILRPRLAQARLLDLFGGSGAIAFELLSNGAAAAVVVELTPKTAELIRLNARSLGVAQAVEVVQGDGIAAIEGLSRKKEAFDIVIVAPPYGLGLQQKAVAALARHPLIETRWGHYCAARGAGASGCAARWACPCAHAGAMAARCSTFMQQGASGVQPLQKA